MSKFRQLSDGSIWNLDTIVTITKPDANGLVYVGFVGANDDDMSIYGPMGGELYDAIQRETR